MIKKSKITAAVMAAILAVTTIFSPVLAGEFSSPEEISEEFSENEKIVEYGTEAFSDAAQVQYDENEETFSTEEGEENNVIVINNTDEADNNQAFDNALNNSNIDIIKIKNKISKNLKEDLNTNKKIIVLEGGELQFVVSDSKLKTVNADLEIKAGATLKLKVSGFSSKIRLSGKLVNNGTVSREGKGDAYIDYTENIGTLTTDRDSDPVHINLVKDINSNASVTIRETATVGDTISFTLDNVVDEVKEHVGDIFKTRWKDTGEYGNNLSYTIGSELGDRTLKLELQTKSPYVFLSSNGGRGKTITSNTCNVAKKTIENVYVNSETGNNSNIGETPQQPVKTLNQALENVKDGGTIILLSDCKQSYASLEKTVTIKSENEDEPKTLTGGQIWEINENKKVTFENLVIQNLEIQSKDKIKNEGSVVFDNVRNASVGGTDRLEAVMLNNSEITCPYLKSSKVEMNGSTLNGRFMTDELIVNGENNILQYTKKNSLGRIDRTATVNGKLVIKLCDADKESIKGKKVLQVPDTLTSLANIELDSSYGDQYELKIRKYDSYGNYMYISEGIAPQIDLYVGNEPRDQENVDMSSDGNISVNAKMTNFSGAHMSVVGNWSGYGENTVWSVGDYPVLTVTVTLTDSYYYDYHFNQIKDFANLINVYTWKDTNTVINKDVKSKATVTVKNNQGISADGRYCTFTLTYPKVKHIASISISADSLNKVYDGNAVKSPAITVPEEVKASLKWYQKSGEDWTKIGAAPTDAGEYSVMAYAEGNENYEAGYSERVEFTISKAPNEWKVNPAINNWTSDQTPSQPAGKAKFGTVSFSYSDKEGGTYTETQPTSSGSWYMKATVAGNDNYDGLEKIIPFTIYTPYYPPIVIPTATPTPSPTPTVKPVPDNYPDGSEYLPDGGIKTPNGTIVDSDGEITLPNGVIVKPGNEENKPALNKENEVITGDGTLVIRLGLSELETGAGWKIFSDGRIVDTDGNVYEMDGSVSDKDGNCVKPAKAMIKNAYTYKNKNQVKFVLYDSCKGAQGYDYVIGKSSNMLQTKEYEKVNKNRKGLKTTFTYMDKGTWYVACHAWVKDANGKKTFGEWSEVKIVVVNAKTPSQPRIISVKTNGSTITVKFSKTGKATGAEVVLGKELEKLYGEKRPVEYKRYVIEEDEDVTTVTFKNVKKGTYYLSLRKWNRTADNNEKVFGPWAEYVKAKVK